MLTIEVRDATGRVRTSGFGEELASYDIRHESFEPGDTITLACDADPGAAGVEVEAQLCDSLAPSRLWLPTGRLSFPVPFGRDADPYGPAAFSGDRHWGWARLLDARERPSFRNLALNSHDRPVWGRFSLGSSQGSHELEAPSGTPGSRDTRPQAYPHARTNTGTTDSWFLARNAIDGIMRTGHHGRWPYGSWGINGRDDAWLEVDFGRPVTAEELVAFVRADFPHDAWWTSARVELSNGWAQEMPLEKTGKPQRLHLGEQRVTWLRVSNLRKADCDSPWPALSQLEVWGRSN